MRKSLLAAVFGKDPSEHSESDGSPSSPTRKYKTAAASFKPTRRLKIDYDYFQKSRDTSKSGLIVAPVGLENLVIEKIQR